MDRVKQQYERYPYPPVGALALPLRGQGENLKYETGYRLACEAGRAADMATEHNGGRILVVGAGTLEALVVAQAHPRAREVVALDLSGASLARLSRRYAWARLRDLLYLAPLRGISLPPLTMVEADLNHWQEGSFDYIIASNVLQHTEDAAAALKHLAGMLAPNGLLRVVTYPAMSRFWIHQVGEWLRWHGLEPETPGLRKRVAAVMAELPLQHPLQSCFRGHGERMTRTGLVDAFLPARERPLAPLLWQQAAHDAGLCWLGESQTETSTNRFLLDLNPKTTALSPWQRLQVLDDLMELAASPVWWFRNGMEPEAAPSDTPLPVAPRGEGPLLWHDHPPESMVAAPAQDWYLPSRIYWSVGQALRRADSLLGPLEIPLATLIEALNEEVGQRVDRHDRPLPGLTVGEYDLAQLLETPEPWSERQWQRLQDLKRGWRLSHNGQAVPGDSLAEQARWLHLRYGADMGMIGPLRFEENKGEEGNEGEEEHG